MTGKIENGEYVVANFTGKINTIDYIDELLQTILLHLTARSGSFYPNKNYGSLLRVNELKQPKDKYALAYARQTLDMLDGVFVKSASVSDDAVTFNLIINDKERQVSLKLD